MGSAWSRRRLLASAGAGVSAGLAGCSTPGSSRTRIGAITVLNMDDTAHDVDVQVTTGGEVVFERSLRAPPGTEPQPVFTRQDGLPTDRREYTVTARLDGGVHSVRRTYPQPGWEGDCYAIVVRIRPDGSMNDMPSEPHSERCATTADG